MRALVARGRNRRVLLDDEWRESLRGSHGESAVVYNVTLRKRQLSVGRCQWMVVLVIGVDRVSSVVGSEDVLIEE
jgi:hypothetical protein